MAVRPLKTNSKKKPLTAEAPDWVGAMATALLTALREKDPYTYGHCRRVGRHARLLAQAAGLNEFEQRLAEYSAMFHDLGKMGIPDSILNKPGRLTEEEAEIMKTHPTRSVEILAPLSGNPFIRATLEPIHHHHERMDGLGYPFGVSGDQIPLTARIILIADTFDAMTTSRSYRKGLPVETAYKELRQFAGRQFDPQLVEIFLQAHPTWKPIEAEISEELILEEAAARYSTSKSPKKKSEEAA